MPSHNEYDTLMGDIVEPLKVIVPIKQVTQEEFIEQCDPGAHAKTIMVRMTRSLHRRVKALTTRYGKRAGKDGEIGRHRRVNPSSMNSFCTRAIEKAVEAAEEKARR